MAEKTEQATPKKLKDARKKGQVAKSQDFSSAFTFIVSISTTLAFTGYLYEQLAGYIVSSFKSISTVNLQEQAPQILIEAITIICTTSLPIAFLTTIVGVLLALLL